MSFLKPDEVVALRGAPDLNRWEGRRDRALMALAVQTGLRLSDLIGLDCGDVELGASPHVHCTGKGRKERRVPLSSPTVAVLRVWVKERAGDRDEPLFPTRPAAVSATTRSSAESPPTGRPPGDSARRWSRKN